MQVFEVLKMARVCVHQQRDSNPQILVPKDRTPIDSAIIQLVTKEEWLLTLSIKLPTNQLITASHYIKLLKSHLTETVRVLYFKNTYSFENSRK